jgi:hypothetical protein
MVVLKLNLPNAACACSKSVAAACTASHGSLDVVFIPRGDVQNAAMMASFGRAPDVDAALYLDTPRALFHYVKANFDLK